jgi:hypothetical protein
MNCQSRPQIVSGNLPSGIFVPVTDFLLGITMNLTLILSDPLEERELRKSVALHGVVEAYE